MSPKAEQSSRKPHLKLRNFNCDDNTLVLICAHAPKDRHQFIRVNELHRFIPCIGRCLHLRHAVCVDYLSPPHSNPYHRKLVDIIAYLILKARFPSLGDCNGRTKESDSRRRRCVRALKHKHRSVECTTESASTPPVKTVWFYVLI